jgi:myo-inositol 2-dehydrogenase/D-chiro-inositol 1-dehydrogenase
VWEAGYFNDEAREFRLTFDRHVDDLLQALRNGERPPVHATAGRRARELAVASITSFEAGRRVRVFGTATEPVPVDLADQSRAS